ncbi:MAG: DUF3618 domain-containing protein [Gemmatimonadaceae bacterium]
MASTTTEVRADIEQTRARMSNAIDELEQKIDVTQKVRDHPWPAIGIALGLGVALSGSRADVKAARVTADATRETSTKLGGALDGVVAALIAGVTDALHTRIDGMVNEVVTAIRGSSVAGATNTQTRPYGAPDSYSETPMRAD